MSIVPKSANIQKTIMIINGIVKAIIGKLKMYSKKLSIAYPYLMALLST
jgi:hypothetical protein